VENPHGHVRYWPLADMAIEWANAAFGGEADIAAASQNILGP